MTIVGCPKKTVFYYDTLKQTIVNKSTEIKKETNNLHHEACTVQNNYSLYATYTLNKEAFADIIDHPLAKPDTQTKSQTASQKVFEKRQRK